jgi:glycosyltransferase involved in cell wall biosynthesis
MYTVIIAERNEADLENTIQNIQETQEYSKILVVHDEHGKGCQVCRDEGIMDADTDIVIIVDGHMRFTKGCLDEQAEYVRANPDKITCAKVHHNSDISFNDSPYCGADIVWKSDEREQWWVLPSKWRSEDTTGEIACILGACYTMSRERYIEVLKRPWSLGHGWGMDEEVLSIANWLCGGTNELVSQEVAHLCRGQGDVPYKLTKQQAFGIWANRLQMLDMFPMEDKDRGQLQQWLMKNTIMRNNLNAIRGLIDNDKVKYLREYYGSQDRTFNEWKDTFITEKEYTMTIQTLRTKCKRAGLKFSMKMTKVDLNKLLNDPNAPKKEVKEVKKREANITVPVKEVEIRCPHCGTINDSKRTNTYPNGNKRRICNACNRPFITMPVR